MDVRRDSWTRDEDRDVTITVIMTIIVNMKRETTYALRRHVCAATIISRAPKPAKLDAHT